MVTRLGSSEARAALLREIMEGTVTRCLKGIHGVCLVVTLIACLLPPILLFGVAVYIIKMRLAKGCRLQFGLMEAVILPLAFTPSIWSIAKNLLGTADYDYMVVILCLVYQICGFILGLLMVSAGKQTRRSNLNSALCVLLSSWFILIPACIISFLIAFFIEKPI